MYLFYKQKRQFAVHEVVPVQAVVQSVLFGGKKKQYNLYYKKLSTTTKILTFENMHVLKNKNHRSRFTKSCPYEAWFLRCFLVAGRQGEICNACVLIVKRVRKLLAAGKVPGRNWVHVSINI